MFHSFPGTLLVSCKEMSHGVKERQVIKAKAPGKQAKLEKQQGCKAEEEESCVAQQMDKGVTAAKEFCVKKRSRPGHVNLLLQTQ